MAHDYNDKYADLKRPENQNRIDQWEKLGESAIEADLNHNSGMRYVGRTKHQTLAWLWLAFKKEKREKAEKNLTFNKVLNHPWTIRIGGGIFLIFIGCLITKFLLS